MTPRGPASQIYALDTAASAGPEYTDEFLPSFGVHPEG